MAAGDLMVVVAERPSTLQITVRANAASGSLQAKLQIEPLNHVSVQQSATQDGDARPSLQRSMAATVPPEDLLLMAHVARRGDVFQKLGDWIGGPDAPAPIEGLQFTGSFIDGLFVEQRVLIAGDAQWTPWRPGHEFAGSRGHARSLTGFHVRLTGPLASRYRLAVEALFLGTTVIRKSGANLEFRSGAGIDPLIGVKIKLESIALRSRSVGPAAEESAMPKSALSTLNHERTRSGVRVFRASRDRVSTSA
ncbi:hypothetical protein [Methyloferula stellata]|uniref:hypothetical protein n=1 Tax=Methyloferula stellata TaxID=876270 RepID=UPI00036845EB|nr:hypothetical protein [Methyloferula stellata]